MCALPITALSPGRSVFIPGLSESVTPETTITPVTTITLETTITAVSQSSDSSTARTTSYTTSIANTETGNYSTESFTLVSSSIVSSSTAIVSSSTFTDTSSSIVSSSTTIVSSSTTNDTAPAINTSSPISVTPSANLSSHNPSFYIGIVLGTVAGIACICALIAWFIRLRRHVRRRHAAKSLKLPWAKPVDDSWGLESGHSPGSDVNIAAISAMHLGSREDLADVRAWTPRGDRDVGEPRRAEGGNNGSTYSLQNHPIPEYCLFSDDSVRAFASSECYSTASLLPHHNLRQLPSHLIDQELAARVSREHASLCSNDSRNRTCGTPRETMNKPRFLSPRGNGLNVPWHLNPSISRSMVERLRNNGKPAEPPWEQISSRQNLDEKDVEAEPWSTSFKSSLVSAFNVVAANLSSAVGTPQMDGNGLSSAPPPKRVNSLSRAGSSNYSTTTMNNIGAQTASRSGSLSIINPYKANDSSDSVVIEPFQISRLSSTDSSTTSTILDGTTGVIEALKDRQNRVLEV